MRGVALAVLVACGGPNATSHDARPADTVGADTGPDPTDGAHSGTRLKITYWSFADGTTQWNAFYDSLRKENCYVYPAWPDGNLYCTPQGASVDYSDANCTQRIADWYRDPNCPQPPPPYGLEWSYTPCNSGPAHLYSLGTQISLAQYYIKNSDGTCGGPYSAGNEAFYAVGGEIAPAQNLVKLAIGSPTTGDRLAPRYLTSTDGLQFPHTMHDAQLGDDCYLAYYLDGATSATCVPSSSAYVGYARDAQCTQLEFSSGKQCATPRYAVDYPYNACPASPTTFFLAGAQVANGSPLYFPSGSQCYSTTADPSSNYFSLAGNFTPQTVTRAPEAIAGHRMQLIHETTATGLRWRDYAIFDSQQGAECYPSQLPDGSTRCLTFGGYTQTFYSSSNCSTPIDLVEVQSGPQTCGAPPLPKFANKYVPPPPGTCNYSYEIHQLGGVYTGIAYQQLGTCTAYSHPQSQLYRVGAIVPLTSFETATLLTDQ